MFVLLAQVDTVPPTGDAAVDFTWLFIKMLLVLGIVSVGAVLVAAKVPGAQDLLPAAFLIIAVTVTFYGLMAVPFAKALGLREEAPEQQTSSAAT